MSTPDPALPTSDAPTPDAPTSVLPASPRRRMPRRVVAVALGIAVVGGSAGFAARSGSGPVADAAPVRATEPVAVPVVSASGALLDGRVAWSQPLTVTAASGTLQSVTAADPDGTPVEGTLGADGIWRSSSTLLPGATYTVAAVAQDATGRTHSAPLTVKTVPAEKVLHARVSPGDGAVVGIGMPVKVVLDRPVEDEAARTLVERRLGLRTEPAVEGSWRWMSDTEVYYRPATYWKPGTRVTAAADLRKLQLPDGTWGSGFRRTSFTIGAAMVSTVDFKKFTMTVTKDGKVLRVLKASMGRPGYETRRGTFIVLEKFREKTLDAASLGVSRGSADYYRTRVEHAVRITNSGTFTHGAPWSVKDQGKRNVSHGCINLAPADAKWFHDLAKRGDIVNVVGSPVAPRLYDAGSSEWNIPFAEWKSGSALA